MGQAASPRAHLACGEASPLGRRQRPRSAGLITPQGRGTSVAERPRPEGQGGGWGRSQLTPIRDPTPKLQGPSAALPPALPWLRRGNWRARVAICPGLQGAAPDPTACLGYRALEYRARDVRAFDIRALEIRVWEIRAREIRAWESVPGIEARAGIARWAWVGW